MSVAETLRCRWVRRNVDEKLRHAIFDARQILFMADVFVCGMYSMWNLDVPCVLEEVIV